MLYVFSRVLMLLTAWHATHGTAFFEELKWRYLCWSAGGDVMLVHIYETLQSSNHLTDDTSRIVKKGF